MSFSRNEETKENSGEFGRNVSNPGRDDGARPLLVSSGRGVQLATLTP
jgi:hypothetical protein